MAKLADGSLQQVEGKRIDLYDWLETFVHTGLNKQTFAWIICEVTTGMVLAGGQTQTQAAERAIAVLDAKGKEATLETIKNQTKL